MKTFRIICAACAVALFFFATSAIATPLGTMSAHLHEPVPELAREAVYGEIVPTLAAVVRPGCAALDAGCGSGILAGLTARAGARVVYAVDNSDMIDVAAYYTSFAPYEDPRDAFR